MTRPSGIAREMQREGSLIGDADLHLFNEGTHLRLHDRLGGHLRSGGAHFAVWAPNARQVSVIGDWNGWDEAQARLHPRGHSGIWEGFVPGVHQGDCYKYRIQPQHGGPLEKADPFGFLHEVPPRTASRAWDLSYNWGDAAWMRDRRERNRLDGPMSIYELHLGSWRRVPEEGNRSLTYREAGPLLAEHCNDLGFTHVELLPIMEHPFFGSWGYQTTGYFAPTARNGTPQDFMSLVDTLHKADIGVILDWVPSHFPNDAHGLAWFDGTHLFDHADPRQGFHPDWASCIFNYDRHEVRSFLLSSAMFWLDKYHADGLRVDAVASMLYLDYSRKAGEWIPNVHGGNDNLGAISFLRRLNESIYQHHPDVQTFAEESTAWPAVSRPTWLGGLGFGLKWDMGWMHDTLRYLQRDPIHRRHHQGEISFRALYAFHENFILPLSHDEVVHGKGSLVGKMPGDEWQRYANLRLLLAYQHATPAKKLLFMGCEFGQVGEWHHDASLDWHVLRYPVHSGTMRLVGDLNRLHRREPALHELDCDPTGFEWVDASDAQGSVYSFLRKDRAGNSVLVVANFTPVPRTAYRVGVPQGGYWRELLNTDAKEYHGSGLGNGGGVQAEDVPWHGRAHSVSLTLPPLALVMFKRE